MEEMRVRKGEGKDRDEGKGDGEEMEETRGTVRGEMRSERDR